MYGRRCGTLGIGRSTAGRTQNRFAAHRIPLAQGGCDHRLHRRNAPAAPAQADRVDFRHQRRGSHRHARFGQRRHTGGALQQQYVEIRPQPRGRQGQHHLREILGYDDALPLQGGGHVVDAQIGGHRPGGLGHELPLPLPGFGAPARQIRPAPAAPASGRRPAAQGGRPGLRHVLRPRAYFGI